MLLPEYATPAPTLKFSPQYFTALTFTHTASLEYPRIATSRIIEGWSFNANVPATASGTLVQPGEYIPYLQDLLPISRKMEPAFAIGMRSVDIILVIDGQRTVVQYHFSKIRLLIAINNNQGAVSAGRSLVNHIVANNILSPPDLERFHDLPILSPIYGFQSARFPLWKIGCLLGETWLEEDVLNTLLELVYLQETMVCTSDPPLLILPTSFFNDLTYLVEQNPKAYSSNFHLIRRRLRALPSATVSFVTCRNDHYSGYRYQTTSSMDLHLGDSLGHAPAPGILPSIAWVLDRTGHQAPPRVRGDGIVARQGPQSGSCGIAAINFVARGTGGKADGVVWEDNVSPGLRNKSIQDLIVYHLVSTNHKAVSRAL
ncbi:hypothetical protein B0H16DRAFT_1296065 [Mycena metata]|uniref:Uncharacterized protein n=1 Tax=Mycena metata TaxID=1033252 RepID=A0AAD7P1U5_9AGAR|nr:hypothetical protein B0H16DRAFT_1296065 [Mycena metata]